MNKVTVQKPIADCLADAGYLKTFHVDEVRDWP